MKLTPEQVRAAVRTINSDIIAENIEGEIGREITDPEYRKIQVAIEDAAAEALGKLDL